MAITSKDMTINHRKVLKKFPFVPASRFIDIDQVNTINSISYDAPVTILSTADAIDNRWHFCKFSNADQESACYVFKLPPNYINGTDITIDFLWTTPSSTAGNGYWDFGLSQKNGSDVFTDADVDTEYTNLTAIAGPTVAKEVITTSTTFSGAGLVAGDTVSFLMMRDATTDNDDTLEQDALVLGLFTNFYIEQL